MRESGVAMRLMLAVNNQRLMKTKNTPNTTMSAATASAGGLIDCITALSHAVDVRASVDTKQCRDAANRFVAAVDKEAATDFARMDAAAAAKIAVEKGLLPLLHRIDSGDLGKALVQAQAATALRQFAQQLYPLSEMPAATGAPCAAPRELDSMHLGVGSTSVGDSRAQCSQESARWHVPREVFGAAAGSAAVMFGSFDAMSCTTHVGDPVAANGPCNMARDSDPTSHATFMTSTHGMPLAPSGGETFVPFDK